MLFCEYCFPIVPHVHVQLFFKGEYSTTVADFRRLAMLSKSDFVKI